MEHISPKTDTLAAGRRHTVGLKSDGRLWVIINMANVM